MAGASGREGCSVCPGSSIRSLIVGGTNRPGACAALAGSSAAGSSMASASSGAGAAARGAGAVATAGASGSATATASCCAGRRGRRFRFLLGLDGLRLFGGRLRLGRGPQRLDEAGRSQNRRRRFRRLGFLSADFLPPLAGAGVSANILLPGSAMLR